MIIRCPVKALTQACLLARRVQSRTFIESRKCVVSSTSKILIWSGKQNFPEQTWTICTKPTHASSQIHTQCFPCLQTDKQLVPFSVHHRPYSSNSLQPLSFHDDSIQMYLTTLLERLIKLQTGIVSGNFDLDKDTINKEITQLRPIVSTLEEYNKMEQELVELQNIGEGMAESERVQLEALTAEEVKRITAEMEILEEKIMALLVPEERGDNNNIILEVSAGVGGSEAFLFTREIFDMYLNYASYRGWQCNVIDSDVPDAVSDGLRKARVSISGEDIYRNLKYEGGVHRVQRVPKTEKQGRVHTSTITVAVMPQPTEIDIQLNPKDVKMDTFRSSGAGGQHVNTTDSAVRLKHLPTGVVVECQASRSQLKNRSLAMNILRSRLYERELAEKTAQNNRARKIQVGTAGRSEKIRTYNFKQDRITDHRLAQNVYGIEDFLMGEEQLAHVIDCLQHEAHKERILELLERTADGKRKHIKEAEELNSTTP